MLNLLLTILLIGSNYGKIQGTVTDEETREPLPYVTAAVLATDLGALADESGRFFILYVPSGRYTVKVSCVGYQTKLIENVIVETDQIARLTVSLTKQLIQLEPIVVTDKAPPIRKEMVAPTFSIKRADLQILPFDAQTGVVMFQPSVVNFDTAIHVRGGRAHEVLYMIDNVSIVDPQTGDLAINTSRGILDEVVFMPGGFDAEYGRAMSGVINVITARPSDRLSLRGFARTERIMPFYYDFGYENYQAALHLPASKKARGFISFDVMHTNDWDPKLFILPHKERDDYSVYGKWVFALPAKTRLTASGARSMSKFDRYNSQWKFRLDHYRSDMRVGDLEALNLVYLPSSKYALNLTLSRLSSEWTYGVKEADAGVFGRFTFKDPAALQWPFTQSPNNPFGVHSHDYFYSEGDYSESRDKSSQVIKTALSTNLQVHRYHAAKAGVEYSLFDLRNYTSFVSDSLHSLIDEYQFRPREFSAYIQDDIDYKGMYLKLGCRYDYYGVDIETIGPKMAVSPRIGFSVMISEKLLLRTNFGLYAQPPLYDQCYSSLSLLPFPSYLTQPPIVGNPDLRPEKTKSFEIGIQGEARENLSIAFSTFYKDVTDLLGTRLNLAYPRNYVTYFNVEEASINGIEAILDFKSHVFSGKLSYALSYAKGTSSSAEEVYDIYYREQLDPTIELPATEYFLDFDQRNRVFIQGVINLPLDTRMCLLGYFGDGFPYTPVGPEGKLEERNILKLPFNRQIDCLVLRSFKIGKLSLNVNLEALNLLDMRYNIAPVRPLIPEDEIQPSDFNRYYTIWHVYYRPAADRNHDGIVTPGEYYDAFRDMNRESDDWPNCYTSPRRARIGITLEI